MTMKLSEEQKLKNKEERKALKSAKDQSTTIRGGGSPTGEDRGESSRKGGGSKTDNSGSAGADQDAIVGINGKNGIADKSSRGITGVNGGGDRGDTRTSDSGSPDAGNIGSEQIDSKSEKTPLVAEIKTPRPRKDVKTNLKDVKKTADKSKKATLTDADTISKLIVNISATYAKTSGKKHWTIEEDEADTIAIPGSIVLQSIPKKQIEKFNKMVAPISLVIAALTVTAPRIAIDMQIAKMKREGAANGYNKSKVGTVQPGGTQSTARVENGGSQNIAADNPSVSVGVAPEIAGIFSRMDPSNGSGADQK